MTGEEAIKAAELIEVWMEYEAQFHRLNEDTAAEFKKHAAAIRALLPLARTGLLVERTLAKHGAFFATENEGETDVGSLHYAGQDGVWDTSTIGRSETLTAAVEAALKGQQ